MSAPSLMPDPNAMTEVFVTGYGHARRPSTPHTGAEYSDVLDAVDRLALGMADMCRTAVDPLAIVAGLEAEGLSDRIAREQYDLPDLFALADELHRRVPRTTDPAARKPEPRGQTGRALLRGLLFTAPALCGIAFLGSSLPAPVRESLAGVQVLAWGYGQGIAHLAYARLGAGDTAAARRVLRHGTFYALLAAAVLFTVVDLLTGTPLRIITPPATTLGFCLAAVPALVLGGEYRLAVMMAPAVLGAVSRLFGAPPVIALSGFALSALGAAMLAVHITRGAKRDHDLSRRDFSEATPHMLSGLGTGAQLTLVLAGPIAGQGLAALHAAIVLTLAMGAGEWHARWYQRQVGSLLGVIGHPAQFPWKATGLLLAALGRQAATAAVLAAIGYILFDRHNPDAVGLYLYTLALAPGMLAALFLRGIDAGAVLWPTVAAVAATAVAVQSHDALILVVLALESGALIAVRAAVATARPWVHL